MKKIISLSLILLASVIVFAQKKVINDANAEARTINGSFHAIKVSDAIDLYLTQGNEEAVAVSASTTEYRNKIKTTVENGVLKIWFDDNNKWWKNGNNRKMKAYVSFKNIDKLNASGASDIYLNSEIKADELELDLSGASDFKGGVINANSLKVEISGASDVTLTGGKVTSLSIDASGASEFKGYDLTTDNCNAEASGASDISVTVNVELNARASGASGIRYKGDGKIRDLKSSGASSVSRKG
jgi:hypothetical protein